METLIEVGLVEALAAALFVGFCLFISYLLQPRKVYERRLAQILDQIAEPERLVPPQLTYRGAPCPAPVVQAPPVEIPAPPEIKLEPAVPVQAAAPVIQLTYRGVPYRQVSVTSSDVTSLGDRPQ
ncbi:MULTISPECIES: hypothetical protein [unclassified Leptolyngbya]|uniref:hypothetical protein n=1 Tax=unclassified Leptolyngbya TaxID=2650499 RepID=UPI00168A1610|nr:MULTISPECIES: hypothetical protein [unclassified Leptolyngbya]MBD1911215.1 hypothetical protein [Leptolyngbya sp. FACHB-8]MBD2155462.1 hypothetical protein [Leptolyngbya sp. FACHB-16]